MKKKREHPRVDVDRVTALLGLVVFSVAENLPGELRTRRITIPVNYTARLLSTKMVTGVVEYRGDYERVAVTSDNNAVYEISGGTGVAVAPLPTGGLSWLELDITGSRVYVPLSIESREQARERTLRTALLRAALDSAGVSAGARYTALLKRYGFEFERGAPRTIVITERVGSAVLERVMRVSPIRVLRDPFDIIDTTVPYSSALAVISAVLAGLAGSSGVAEALVRLGARESIAKSVERLVDELVHPSAYRLVHNTGRSEFSFVIGAVEEPGLDGFERYRWVWDARIGIAVRGDTVVLRVMLPRVQPVSVGVFSLPRLATALALDVLAKYRRVVEELIDSVARELSEYAIDVSPLDALEEYADSVGWERGKIIRLAHVPFPRATVLERYASMVSDEMLDYVVSEVLYAKRTVRTVLNVIEVDSAGEKVSA